VNAPPISMGVASRPSFRRTIAGARNVMASYLGAGAEGAVFILLTPFLVRRLGLGGYGLWGLAVSLADWLPLLDFGLRDALLKYVAAHQAKSDASAARKTIEAVAFAYVLLGLLAVALVILASWGILPRFVDDPGDVRAIRAVFLILGMSAAIGLPAGTMGSLLEALSRFDLLNLLRIAHQMLRLVLVVLAIQFGLGVVGVAAADFAARMALHAARFVAIRRIHPELIPRPWPHLAEIDRLFGLGVWNALRQVTDVASLKVFEPILAAFAGLPAVGAFYAGRRFAAIPAEAIVPLAGVLFPLSSEMQTEGRHSDLRRTLVETTKVALVVSVPFALVIGIGAPMIQSNWLGGRAPGVEIVMSIFAAVFVGVAAFLPAEAILLGLGRSQLVSLCTLANLVMTIGLGIPLTARLGTAGLALAALAATLTTQVAVLIPAAGVACGVPAREILGSVVAPALLAGVPVGAVMTLFRDRLAAGGLAGLVAWSGGAVALYAALAWRLVLSSDERRSAQRQLSRAFGGVAGEDAPAETAGKE
jgi:O-antigen/teichoic acid export membrane protein